ncbi:FLTOP protein, partial [Acromyrmex insinuator]
MKMSQHWHGHWTEDTFAPKRLRNWEVPKWYPSWPDRHCVTTKFIVDNNGRMLDNVKRVGQSPWGTFKGTWDLPKKITASIAKELSITLQYKKDLWEQHKKKHENLCKRVKYANKNRNKEINKL